MSFLLSKLGGDIELALLGHDEEVPIAVVHGPVLHGGVTRVHVYRDPMPGLAVTRSCKSSETTLVTCRVKLFELPAIVWRPSTQSTSSFLGMSKGFHLI